MGGYEVPVGTVARGKAGSLRALTDINALISLYLFAYPIGDNHPSRAQSPEAQRKQWFSASSIHTLDGSRGNWYRGLDSPTSTAIRTLIWAA